jgi:hypothetical protein
MAVQPVQPLASNVPYLDSSHFAEHPQVLRHLWLGQAKQAHEVVHGTLPVDKGVEDLSSAGLGHGVE